jgi:hypothetical protein
MALRYPALNLYTDAQGAPKVVLTYSPANGDGIGMAHVNGLTPTA